MSYSDVIMADSPQGFWHLDETVGSSAIDSSGHGRTGTYVDSPTLGEPGAGSLTGTSVKFTKQADKCTIASYTTVLQQFSLECWLKVHDYPGSGYLYEIISKRSYYAASTADFPCYFSMGAGGGLSCGISIGNDYTGDRGVGTSAISKDVWHHCVATWDGTYVRIYVDGALVATSTGGAPLTLSTNTQPWTFGKCSQEYGGGANTSGLSGWLDEVAIYSTALSLERIQAHYAAREPAISLFRGNVLALEARGPVAAVKHLPIDSLLAGAIGTTRNLLLDFAGYVTSVATPQLEAAGYVGGVRTAPFEILQRLAPQALVPLDTMGPWNALAHSWLDHRYEADELEHIWQVLQMAAVGQLPHAWDVLTVLNDEFPHLWRVLPPEIVTLRGRDIQLPYGTVEKTS